MKIIASAKRSPVMSSHLPIGLNSDLVLARFPSVQSRTWEIKRNTEPIKKYPNAKSLANAKLQDVKEIIKPIGFYNNKAKNIIKTSKILVKDYNSKVPNTMQELIKLPGVGRKVASCVLVYAFNKAAIPVDVHVHKISNRLGWVKTKTPEQTEKALEKIIPKKYWLILNDVFVVECAI